ncbi:MAG: hypothetical protein QOJ27_2727 [Sphingomonadales bacterium]|nr:hypothetical protein [Sphingomonadales bacterium]
MASEQDTQRRPAPAMEREAPGARAVGIRSVPLVQLAAELNSAPRVQALGVLQAAMAPNRTGMPDRLKTGIEAASGLSMDDVTVHYNSGRPAELQAHAFAQGTDIHLAPGQERHLPHEAWHVVQQAQGRVPPTRQLRSGVSVNDDKGLEREADAMGARALAGVAQLQGDPLAVAQRAVVQRVLDGNDFTRAKLGQVASGAYGLRVWSDGEFISANEEGKEDDETNNVHVHVFQPTVGEEEVVVTGHAIWNKHNGRNQQGFTMTATLEGGGRWSCESAFGAEEIAVQGANPDLKKTLYNEVVNQLATMIEDTLNEDVDLDEESDEDRDDEKE